MGLGLTPAPSLHRSFLLPLEEAWWLALTLAEVTSAGREKPVKGTEKLCNTGWVPKEIIFSHTESFLMFRGDTGKPLPATVSQM